MQKYRHLLEDRFLPWAERKGLHNLEQVSVDVLDFKAKYPASCGSG